MPDGKSTSTCALCGKQKKETKSATLTGWIFDTTSCRCDFTRLDDPKSQEITAPLVCRTCQKILPGQAKRATITQWIFRPDSCTCKTHVATTNDATHEFKGPEENNRSGSRESLEPSIDSLANANVEQSEALKELSAKLALPERYSIIRMLGRGGNGVVCEARDSYLNRTVAVKIIDRVSMEPEKLVRFQSEAKITSRLTHRNIVAVLDLGVNRNDQPFMVLENVTGKTLRQHLNEHGPLDNEQARAVFAAVASALAHAHKSGISHRDLKPENLILHLDDNSNMEPKLIDFGLAKHVQSQHNTMITQGGITLVGTPAYMSPDQANARTYDVRSEVYSFGCVLFEALVGSPPFAATTPLELLAKHSNEAPPNAMTLRPTIEKELSELIDKCLRKLPDDRVQSFDQIYNTLTGEFLPDESASTTPPAALSNKSPVVAPNVVTMVATATAIVMVVGVSVVLNHNMKNQNGNHKQSNARDQTDEDQHYHSNPADQSKASRIETTAATARYTKEKRKTGSSQTNALNLIRDAAEKPSITYSPDAKSVRLRGDFYRDDFKIIPQDKNIEAVKAFYGQHLDPDGFQSVIGNMKLQCLHLSQSDAGEKIFNTIANMPSIQKLVLKGTKVTDQSLAKLARLPLLSELVLDNCKITDIGVASLANCPKLARLELSNTDYVTEKGLSTLNKLKLKNFFYSQNKLDDDEIRAICKLKIDSLYLNNCGIDDREAALFNSKSVRVLYVTGNEFGPAGLRAFLKMPSIRAIFASASAALSDEKVRTLSKSVNPNCVVTLASDNPDINMYSDIDR
ncbi:MAG: protein kinase [Candidatus Melainabacteria bacterium]|nr:protein kinase [Candidatus Melainabacteria bacterium]